MLDDLRETAVNALPPVREEEPESLRREILDELTDHFACAYRRELLRTRGDADLSRRNVLSRFGDPARIARQLWFDAMKGKLMAQKLMVAVTCLCALFTVIVALLGWRLVDASQQATSALIAQNQKANTTILARLEALSTKDKNGWEDSLEWSEFELKFVEEGTGEPATDVTVTVTGPGGLGSSSEFGQEYVRQHPDGNGVFRASPVHVGQYSVAINSAAGSLLRDYVQVRPGHDFQKTYTVPAKQGTGKLDLEIEWPERLRGRDMWCVIGAVQDSSRTVDGHFWEKKYRHLLAVHTSGRIRDLTRMYQDASMNPTEIKDPNGGTLQLGFAPLFVDLVNDAPPLDKCPPGHIAPWLMALIPSRSLPEDPNLLAHNVYAIRFPTPADLENLNASFDLFRKPLEFGATMKDGGYELYDIPFLSNPGSLTISPDRTTTWTLTIPEHLAGTIPEEMLPPPTPVEAPKPAHTGLPLSIPSPTTLTIRCVDDSPEAVPVPNVELSYDQSKQSPYTAYNPKGDPIPAYRAPQPIESQDVVTRQTDANGVCRFDNFVPGRYRFEVTLPDGTSSTFESMKNFKVNTDGTLEKTIVCPTSPERFPVDLAVSWPAAAKQRNDVWAILEIGEELRHEIESGSWSAPAAHLIAIHPDGQMVQWEINPENRGRSIYDLVDWPQKEARFVNYMGEVTTTTAKDPGLPVWLGAEHRLLGLAIARWNGRGSPNALLRGVRDGRYQPGQMQGKPNYDVRKIFFHILREIVPMASYKEPPRFEIRPAANGNPTFTIDMPEPLVQSALRRWDEVPVAIK